MTIPEQIKQKAKPAHKMPYYEECVTTKDVLKVLKGCVCVPKQKMMELADLLKNRPKIISADFKGCYQCFRTGEWFEGFEKKFVELTEQ